MEKKTVMYLWVIVITLLLILIPFIQNAWAWPSSSWISFFMGYYKYISEVYLYIISMGMFEWVLITLFIQSLMKNIQDQNIDKFDLDK